jgi:nucleoside-diphosphate-sugar epimerase
MTIIVTGSSGFLGGAIWRLAQLRSLALLNLDRHLWSFDSSSIRALNSDVSQDYRRFVGCRCIIHLAARAHVIHDSARDSLSAFRIANTIPTLALAKAAIVAGVPRFVFVSSIGVLGNHSVGTPFRPADPLRPYEPYAVSKAEAEVGLHKLCATSGTELIIIRPPLIHGPSAKGNFRRLMEGIWAGKVLPLGGVINNRRSFVGVDNAADAILNAVISPILGKGLDGLTRRGAGDLSRDECCHNVCSARSQGDCLGRMPTLSGCLRTYHIADDGAISTRRLVELLAEGMGVKARLISVPRWLAVGGATLLGKGAMARRLFADLEVDSGDFNRDYDWRPRLGLEDGLRLMAEDFARRMRNGLESS